MEITKEEHLSKALDLIIQWAIECNFGYDNIPEEYEHYKDEIKDMGMKVITTPQQQKLKDLIYKAYKLSLDCDNDSVFIELTDIIVDIAGMILSVDQMIAIRNDIENSLEEMKDEYISGKKNR